MPGEKPKVTGGSLAKAVFWIVLGAQWACVPFLALMLFFGLLGYTHFSPEERRAFLMAAAYIPALIGSGFLGVRLLRSQRHPLAIALALAPVLLIAPTVIGVLVGG